METTETNVISDTVIEEVVTKPVIRRIDRTQLESRKEVIIRQVLMLNTQLISIEEDLNKFE